MTLATFMTALSCPRGGYVPDNRSIELSCRNGDGRKNRSEASPRFLLKKLRSRNPIVSTGAGVTEVNPRETSNFETIIELHSVGRTGCLLD
jgi:hypothetical protein